MHAENGFLFALDSQFFHFCKKEKKEKAQAAVLCVFIELSLKRPTSTHGQSYTHTLHFTILCWLFCQCHFYCVFIYSIISCTLLSLP